MNSTACLMFRSVHQTSDFWTKPVQPFLIMKEMQFVIRKSFSVLAVLVRFAIQSSRKPFMTAVKSILQSTSL